MSASTSAGRDPRGFVLANTRILAPPLVPEVVLHLAEESIPLWEKTESQLDEMNVPPPFWAFAWAGGQALARHVLDHRAVVAGRRVLDLGAGSGLCGIAAKIAGARTVTAADTDVLAVHAIALNAEANGVSIQITSDDLLSGPPVDADIVLIGDLYYEKDLSERVTRWILDSVSQGQRVWIGDPQRSFFPVCKFERLAEYSVPVTRALEDTEIKRTSVWRCRR